MEMIEDIKARDLVKGIKGHYKHGDQMTFGLVFIKAGADLAAHSHVHEQITYMLEGELEMKIGNELVVLRPGAVQVIPSNVVHGASALTDCKLIDVFNPVREDYR